jgi:hypothetical protein
MYKILGLYVNKRVIKCLYFCIKINNIFSDKIEFVSSLQQSN